jgi:hypothetical protein
MITLDQAARLTMLADAYAGAAADAEMAGAQPPEEAQWLRDQKARTKDALRSYIHTLKEKVHG